MSSSNCRLLTCIQISQKTDQVVLYSHLFKNFPQFIVIHTVEGFGIVNKAEIDVFLELSCFLIWSLVPLPFPNPAWTSWSSWFTYCWSLAWRILSQLFHSPLSFIKRLFSYSSLSAIKVVSSAYLRLLIFLPAILIPTSASSSLVFHMMDSAYKLNKHGDKKQPWWTPFPVWNQSVISCSVLTVASWLAYRFLRRQLRWSGIPISLRIFQFVVIHTVKGFRVVNKAEVGVLLEFSYFF